MIVHNFRTNFLLRRGECKTRENPNFLKKGKMVISVRIRKFSRSRMMKRTSPLELSVSNSALGLLYGHGILTIYENLLL